MLQVENSFTWDPSAAKIKSKLTGINLAGPDGPKSVDSTSKPMEIYIENHPLPKNDSEVFEIKENNDTKNYSSMSVEDNGEQWSYHTTNVKNESVRMVIDLFNKTKCQSFDVYMRQNKQPTVEKYRFKWSLPNNQSCRWKNESWNGDPINLGDADPSDYECDQDTDVIFISDSENLDGKFIVGT